MQNIEKTINSLIPDQENRKLSLNIFLETIRFANSFGSNKWGTSTKYRVGLSIGSLIIFTIEKDRLWMALDKEFMNLYQDDIEFLISSGYWEWDEKVYPEYNSIQSKNGYYVPCSESLNIWNIVKKFHFQSIKKESEKRQQLKINSQEIHNPALLAFLRKELNQPVPEPIYQSKTKSKTEELGLVTPQKFQFPEEVDESEVQILREGAVQQVTVNAYERNPKARQLCIAHYGLSCYVCGFNFEERYGEVGKDFIHVHHERPLSTIGEEYEVDPIQDLKPVCANCHAIIHRCKQGYSVEKVREMLH